MTEMLNSLFSVILFFVSQSGAARLILLLVLCPTPLTMEMHPYLYVYTRHTQVLWSHRLPRPSPTSHRVTARVTTSH